MPEFRVYRYGKQTDDVVCLCRSVIEWDGRMGHVPSRTDNLGKAKGLAEYAEHYGFGRIQLIRKTKAPAGGSAFKRLDMSKSEIRTKMKSISTNEELDHLFDECGFFE